MSYEDSFLATADAEGMVPSWALNQIFQEHGSDINEYTDNTPEAKRFDGETILEWLGY